MHFRAQDLNYDLQNNLLLMGILNITPDSFSEDGANVSLDHAVSAGLKMVDQGADMLDIGGESTRPGAEPVRLEEELSRVIPVIRELRKQSDVAISIDTWKADVARQAIEAGAQIINDISGFHRDPEIVRVAAESKAGCIAMHMRGTPQDMQSFTNYDDMIREINDYFRETITMMTTAGVEPDRISLDPGIGFSKTVEQNLELVNRLDAFEIHGRPLFLGTSRKSFIGKTLGVDDPQERLWGTAASLSCGILRGARILRVHDVLQMRQVCDMTAAILWNKEIIL